MHSENDFQNTVIKFVPQNIVITANKSLTSPWYKVDNDRG